MIIAAETLILVPICLFAIGSTRRFFEVSGFAIPVSVPYSSLDLNQFDRSWVIYVLAACLPECSVTLRAQQAWGGEIGKGSSNEVTRIYEEDMLYASCPLSRGQWRKTVEEEQCRQ